MLLMDEPELYARKALRSSPGQLSMFTGLEHTGTASDFREDLHPRDDDGKFRPKGVAKAGQGPTVEESPTGQRKRTMKSSAGQMPLPLGDEDIAEAKRLIQQMRGEAGPRAPLADGEKPFSLKSGKPEPVKPTGNNVQKPLFGEDKPKLPAAEPPKSAAKPVQKPLFGEGAEKPKQTVGKKPWEGWSPEDMAIRPMSTHNPIWYDGHKTSSGMTMHVEARPDGTYSAWKSFDATPHAKLPVSSGKDAEMTMNNIWRGGVGVGPGTPQMEELIRRGMEKGNPAAPQSPSETTEQPAKPYDERRKDYAAQVLAAVKERLAAGERVLVPIYGKPMVIDQRHADMLKTGGASIYIKSGNSWADIGPDAIASWGKKFGVEKPEMTDEELNALDFGPQGPTDPFTDEELAAAGVTREPEAAPEPPKTTPADPEFSLSAKPKHTPAKIEGSGKARQVDLFAGRGDSPGQTSFFDDIDPAAKNVGAMEKKSPVPTTQKEAVNKSTIVLGGGKVHVAATPERQELLSRVMAAKGRAEVESLIGKGAAERWYRWRIGGSEPWTSLVNAMQWQKHDTPERAAEEERQASEAAIAASKPVPPEVLAEYPDLAKKPSDPHADLIERASKFAEYGENYNRNIAAPLNRLLEAKAKGHSQRMLDGMAEELRMRLDVHGSKANKPADPDIDALAKSAVDANENVWTHAKSAGHNPIKDWTPEQRQAYSDAVAKHREAAQPPKPEPSEGRARAMAAQKQRDEAGTNVKHSPAMQAAIAQTLEKLAPKAPEQPAAQRSSALDDKIASSTGLIAKIGKQMGVKPQDMDDFISDVQLKAIKGQGGYDAEKGEFSTWLATVARNHKMTQQARQKAGKRAGVTQSLATPLEGGKGSLADTVAAKPEKREIGDALDVEKVREAMGSLPDKQREAFMAVMTGGKSVTEAAAEMGISKQAVSAYVNLAKAKIKAAVGVEEEEEAEPAKEPPKPTTAPQTLAEKVAAQRAAGKKATPPKAKPKPKTMVSMSGGRYELVKENGDGTVTVKNDQGDEFTSDPGEDYQIEQRKTAWKKNEDGTYTAPNGVVWRKAAAGGEESPVNGKPYAGGALMPIHGQSQVKIGKGDGSGEQPDLKPGRPDENQEAKAKKKGVPRRPQRVRDRLGELVEVPEGHRPLESVVAGHPLKHNKLNDDALAYLGLTRKQAQEIGEIYEMDGGSPYVPNEILPPSTINRNVAPDDSWSILKKYREHQEAKGRAARAKDADMSGLDPDMRPKATPEAVKQPFSPEQAIKIAANSVKELRKQDVYRVLDSNPAEHMDAIADHVKKNRPELASEVDSALSDIHEERGATAKPAQAATPQVAATAPPPPAKEKHPVLERLARSNDPTYTATHGLGERDRWDLINHLGLAERAMKGENVLPDIMAAGKNRRSELDAEDAAAAEARNQEIAAAASRREASRQRLTAGLSRGTRGTLSLPTGTVTGTKVGPLFVHKTGTGYAISHQGTAGKIRELPKQADAVDLAGVLAKVPGWDFTDANKMPESLRNAVGMAIRDHDNGDWEGIEKRLSQGGGAPPEQPPGSALTGWHKDEFTGLHDAMKKQLAGQGSRRQESLARSLMESSPPAVQKELFRALKSIAPEAHAAIAAKPGIHLHKETFQ